VLAEFLKSSFGGEAACMQNADALGEAFGDVEDVGGEDDSVSAANEIEEDVLHETGGAGVETGERFIEQHDGGLVDERAAERHLLFHAAGKTLDGVVAFFPEAEGLKQFFGAGLAGGRGEIPERGDELEVFERAEFAVEDGVVGDVSERPFGGGGVFAQRSPFNEYLTSVRSQKAGDHADGGGFAGAVGTEERVEQAARHAEIKAIDGLGVAETFAEAARFAREDGGLGGGVIHRGEEGGNAVVAQRCCGDVKRLIQPRLSMRTLTRFPFVAALTLAGLFNPQLTAAPAAVSTVVATERSAHFDAVNKHLELGGVLYGYVDIDGDVAEFGREMTKSVGRFAEINPMLAMAQQDYVTLFGTLGLTDVKALGLSSVASEGGYRNRIFFYTPEGRRGLLAMVGGAPKPFANAVLAPADADLFVETELDTQAAYAGLRAVVQKVGGDGLVNTLERELKKPTPQGIVPYDLIQKFSGRYTLIVRIEPETRIPLPSPGEMTVPSISILIKADGIAPALENALAASPILVSSVEEGRRVLQMPQPAPNTTLQPAVIIDGETLLIGSSKAFILECLSRKSGLNNEPTFVKALAELGGEGNGLAYVTPRFFNEIRKVMTDASALNPQVNMALESWIEVMPVLARPVVSLRRNEANGVLVKAYSHRSMKTEVAMLTMANPVTIGLMAAMAIPAFQKVRTNSQEKTIHNNLRQFSAAAQQHMLEHATTSATYADVVGPEDGKYIRELKPVRGEDYTSLVLKESDTEISVTTADGKVISIPVY
jgi:type IV pilus assembly protein PilA